MHTSRVKRLVSAQLRVGDTDLASHTFDDIREKIDDAIDLAHMRRLLFQPTRDKELNRKILDHSRNRELEIYLWYPVLGDNNCIPESGELMQDAFGNARSGETGRWSELPLLEEGYLAACPTNHTYNRIILEQCQRRLADYDGLFLDTIGYPLPSLGIESMFTCFCPNCQKLEPRLAEWREAAYEFKERIVSATDTDLNRWDTLTNLGKEAGLDDFYRYRSGLITAMAKRYADMAREMNKGIGMDVLNPAFMRLAGHDPAGLGKLADWLKPRIYCHTFGLSSIPLEFYCLTMGLKSWGKRISIPGGIAFLARSLGLDVPTQLQNIRTAFRSGKTAAEQISKTCDLTTAPVFPGIECSHHPEYETSVNEHSVSTYLEASRGTPGVVLSWNLLYVPAEFMKLVGAWAQKAY